MDSINASDLLDRLYRLTDDSKHWPDLIQALLELLDSGEAAASKPLPLLDEQRFLAWLTPHVLRVLDFHQTRLSQALQEDFFAAFVGQQSIALALCDNQGSVRWMSRPLAEALEQVSPQALQRMLRSTAQRPSVHDVQTPDGPRKLVLVDVPALGPSFCALMLSTQSPTELDAQQLAQMYGLTPAEVSIAKMLVQGISTEDIALANDTAVATVRSQIKKAMAKLGVSRQAELVAMLHTHTARVHFGVAPVQDGRTPVHSVLAHRGAQVAYNIIGPADGLPVFFLHSWAGSRLQALRSARFLFAHGIKLIAFDRIGMGASLVTQGNPPSALADLVRALADHLKLPQFSVLGYSLGSYYALQCAAALPDTIQQVFLVCPVAPMRGLKDLKGLLPSGQLLMGLAMKAPVLAQALVRLWMAQMRRNPTLYLQSVLPHLPASDAQTMQDPAVQYAYVASFMEAIRQGDDALLRELGDMAQDWGHHRQVQQATQIWHGQQDSHVPFVYAQRLADEMPAAQLHAVPNAGHFLMFHHWDAVLAQIRASSAMPHPQSTHLPTPTKEIS